MFGIDISPLVMKLLGIAVVVIAIGVLWLSFAIHYEHKGRDKVISQDQGAISRAKTGTNTVDECYAAGGNWDSTRGVCN